MHRIFSNFSSIENMLRSREKNFKFFSFIKIIFHFVEKLFSTDASTKYVFIRHLPEIHHLNSFILPYFCRFQVSKLKIVTFCRCATTTEFCSAGLSTLKNIFSINRIFKWKKFEFSWEFFLPSEQVGTDGKNDKSHFDQILFNFPTKTPQIEKN